MKKLDQVRLPAVQAAAVICLLLTSALSAAAADLAERFDTYLAELAADGFSGIVLVAKDGDVVFERGYGLADRERGLPIGGNTVFTVGSITKQFTGAAILQLEAADKLAVEDPIGRYFDGVPADKKGMTLHHLLTHTAGFPGAIGDDFDVGSRDDFVRQALVAELATAPGERYEYSNVGYSLLAAVIEQVSGKSYEDYIREHLFLPAGMKDTGYTVGWKAKRLAQGYRGDAQWGTVAGRIAEGGLSWHLRGNGGIHSTARDMLRWHRALEGTKILPAAAKEKLYGRHVSEGGDTYYGYGWSLADTSRGTRLVAHNGGNMIFFADFLRFLDDDLVVFLASGNAQRRRGRIAYELARMVFDPSYRPEGPRRGETRAQGGQGGQGGGTPPPADELTARYGLPGSATGRRAAALLAAIESNDAERYRSFVKDAFAPAAIERYTLDGLVEMLGRLAGDLGKFELKSATKVASNRAKLGIETPNFEHVELELELESEEPYRIVGLGVDVE